MIEHLVQEIQACLANDLQIAALTMALTLPDSCGKVYCPNCKNRERYVRWFDDYITKPREKHFGFAGDAYSGIDGETAYKLRCSMLHELNPAVTNAHISKFSLIWQNASRASRTAFESCCTNEKRTVSVDIVTLCEEISDASLRYYQDHKESFTFDYRIISASDCVSHNFGVDNEMNV